MENKKTKLKITSCKGRLLYTYPRQQQAQDRYIEVSANGRLHIDWNAEIGNAVPSVVRNGIERRISGDWNTKSEAMEFIRAYRSEFEILVAGMGEKWDGNNTVGTLTEAARTALETLEYAAYSENQY